MKSQSFPVFTRFRHWPLLSACLVGVAWSHPVAAEEGIRDCSAVYDAAHEAELAGELSAATELFQQCALEGCSNPTRHSCEARLLRLELDAPSVVPLAKDAAGEPLVEAQVTMDGTLLTSRLDGRAIAVDPGLHEFVFSAAGQEFGRVRTVIAQGQRNRELWMSVPAPGAAEAANALASAVQPLAAANAEATEEAAAPAPQPTASHPEPEPAPQAATSASPVDDHGAQRSLLPYALGGAALLGGGAYALLSTWAREDNQLLGRCAPNCPQASLSHIRNLYIAADISLGVGIAAAIGGITSWLLSGPSSSDQRSHGHDFAWTVQPQRSGALATFRGTL